MAKIGWKGVLKALGPGVITGAADDDPSGIATYSVAGAQLGTSLLWTALLTWPLMGCVQMLCARVGMVTGAGLTHGLRKKFPTAVIVLFSVALLVANTINIGADLIGMADAAEMLTGLNSRWFVILFGAGITILIIRCHYEQIASILKWLCLVLFAYVVVAFVVVADWPTLLRDTFIPSLPHGGKAWATMVAILGTTISPYLFYWQASHEVEDEKAKGRRMLIQRQNATRTEIAARRIDVGLGTLFSNIVMYFIIVATAMSLHNHGITEIETSKQAAEALRPLAGKFATALYTLGIVGVGLLSIPVLAGSAAYALAETFDWRQGIGKNFTGARRFYVVIIISVLAGIAADFLNLNAVKALYWTAIINGLLAPFILVGVLMVASDRKIMINQPAPKFVRVMVSITTVLMFCAAVGMFLF